MIANNENKQIDIINVCRGLAMRILSVCLSVRWSVRLSNACIVTKREKDLSRFLHHTKEHLA